MMNFFRLKFLLYFQTNQKNVVYCFWCLADTQDKDISWVTLYKTQTVNAPTSTSNPVNTPHVLHVETTWKRPFPRRSKVDQAWCVCMEYSKPGNGNVLRSFSHWQNGYWKSILFSHRHCRNALRERVDLLEKNE